MVQEVSPIIANFHGIGEPPAHVELGERRFWLSPAQFHQALDRLRQSGRPVLITFDDGNKTDLTVGLPACLEREFDALFFVCSDRVGHRDYLSKGALREIAATSGCAIGSHGKRHVPWRRLSERELADEVGGSRSALEWATGLPVTIAALPFGAYDRQVLHALVSAGYTKVFSSDGGPRLSREGVQPRQSMRGDRPLRAQVDALVASATIAHATFQEAKVRWKSRRHPR